MEQLSTIAALTTAAVSVSLGVGLVLSFATGNAWPFCARSHHLHDAGGSDRGLMRAESNNVEQRES